MLLDDPSSSLDNKVTSNIINRICRHPKWSKKTYVISTRKISVLKKMDKVIFMENGKVSFFGPFSQLKEKKEFIDYAQANEEQEGQKNPNEEPIEELASLTNALEVKTTKSTKIKLIFSKKCPNDLDKEYAKEDQEEIIQEESDLIELEKEDFEENESPSRTRKGKKQIKHFI